MKVHTGVDKDSGLIHNVHDLTPAVSCCMEMRTWSTAKPVTWASLRGRRWQARQWIQGRDASRQTQGATGHCRGKAARSARDGQGSYPLKRRKSLPHDQAAVQLSEDQVAWPDQEPLEDQRPGSTIESVPGPTEMAGKSMIRAWCVCTPAFSLKTSPKSLTMRPKVIRKWAQREFTATSTLPARCPSQTHFCPEIP